MKTYNEAYKESCISMPVLARLKYGHYIADRDSSQFNVTEAAKSRTRPSMVENGVFEILNAKHITMPRCTSFYCTALLYLFLVI